MSLPESSKYRPVPRPELLLRREDRERVEPQLELASWAQSGQMSWRTFHPPSAFFFARRTDGWAWQYPSSSNGSAPYLSVLRPPFLEELDLTLLLLLRERALPVERKLVDPPEI